MDPNTTLAELRQLSKMALDTAVPFTPDDLDALETDFVHFAELFTALDNWMSTGGFLPKRWSKNR
jgi:hypothetical protein